jgi:hypothetical protein
LKLPSAACNSTRLSCGWSFSTYDVLVISTFDSIVLLSSLFRLVRSYSNFESRGLCSNTHIVGSGHSQSVIYNDDEQRRGSGNLLGRPVSELTRAMRMIEITIGVILLGGAAWTTVKTYKGRGISSSFVLAFAVFLVALVWLFSLVPLASWCTTSGSGASGSNEPGTKRKKT